MKRRDLFSSLGFAATGLFAFRFDPALAALPTKDDPEADADDPKRPLTVCSFDECADACQDAAKACHGCFDHCTTLLQAGKRGYSMTMRTCIDCAEVCSTCAALCSRESRLTKVLTEACARFCDRAASECEKFGADLHMVRCAKACRRCAAHCRGLMDEMLIA